jgi:protein SCO1/2
MCRNWIATLSLAMTMLLSSCQEPQNSKTPPVPDVEESMRIPKEMQGGEIIDKLGTKIDQSLVFTRHDGVRVPLSDYFGPGKTQLPTIVTLGYYECPALCNLVLKSTLETLGRMSLKLGKDYRVLSFTIKPQETADLAAAKRKTHLKALGLEDGAWDFFTGDEKSIAALAKDLGFGYKFHESSGEYAHGAGIFILSKDGMLSRTMWGLSYDPWATKMALVEAADGKVGSVVDRILLSCFHYVPDKHKYGLYVFGAMRVGGALTVLFLVSMLGWYLVSERRRRKCPA